MKKYTVSSRKKTNINSFNDEFGKVYSVFGFCDEFSKLYGGRIFSNVNTLSYKDINNLYDQNIYFTLTLTNDNFSKQSYNKTLSILNKLHKPNNSITITNDELAFNIRKDFPLFKLNASVIKEIDDIKSIEHNFKLYDFITLHPKRTLDKNFLKQIENKSNIILFKNATCLYTCNQKFENKCYRNISDANFKNIKRQSPCKKIKTKKQYYEFDINEEIHEEFKIFKKIEFKK